MVTSIRIDRNVPVEVRDGGVLKADIYCPADGARHPAILFRTPYDKSTSGNSDYLNLVQAAHAGYAIVVQDVRGRFASAGEWRRENMFIVEGLDGFDTVEWIASQRWCDGNVGSAGGSYLAGLQWTTAMESPPHLKAMAPWMGITGPGMEPPPTGGAILLTVAMTATPMMAVDIANRAEQAGQDVTELRAAILWAQSDPAEALNFLPLKDIPFAQFDRVRETWKMRLTPPSPEEQTRRQRFERVQVPCFYACGWYDVMERLVKPGEEKHRYAFHDRKAWWQQEQGILAYLILHGILAGAKHHGFETQDVDFFLGRNYLVTVHAKHSRSISEEQTIVLRHGSILGDGPCSLLHRIVDRMVEEAELAGTLPAPLGHAAVVGHEVAGKSHEQGEHVLGHGMHGVALDIGDDDAPGLGRRQIHVIGAGRRHGHHLQLRQLGHQFGTDRQLVHDGDGGILQALFHLGRRGLGVFGPGVRESGAAQLGPQGVLFQIDDVVHGH